MKTKKKIKVKSAGKKIKKGKLSKAQRVAARDAKKKARKGDGSFPDILVITQETSKDGEEYFAAHDGSTMDTIYKNDTTVAVYKLRRVSKIVINRKIAR